MSLDTLIEAAKYLEKIEANRDSGISNESLNTASESSNSSGIQHLQQQGHMKLDPNLPISFHFHTYSSQVPTQSAYIGNTQSLPFPIINNKNSTNRGYSISLPSQSELSLSPRGLSSNVNHIMVVTKDGTTESMIAPTTLTRSGSFGGRGSGEHSTRGGGRSRTVSSSVYDKDSTISNRHRELHKTLEKNRRAHLRHCFEQLKQELPKSEYSDKKSSHINIIHCAIRYIECLKKNDIEYVNEIERLSRTKTRYLNHVTQLREDLIHESHKDIDIQAVLNEAEEKVLKVGDNSNEVLVDGIHMSLDEDEHSDVIVDLEMGQDYDDEATTTASECADDVRETLNQTSFTSVASNGPLLSHA